MTEKISYIPSRIKNAAVGGHVAGADDIIDDDLGLTQNEINRVVFAGNITVGLEARKNGAVVSLVFAREAVDISLTASSSVKASRIVITKDGESGSIADVQDVSTAEGSHHLVPAVGSNTYRAAFSYSGIADKTATKTVTGADKIFYGLGTASMSNYSGITNYCAVRTTPVGAIMPYTPTVGSYCYILLPTSMGNTDYSERIKIVSSGLGYAMDKLSGTVTKDGTTYYVYRGAAPNNSTEAFSLTISN